MSRESKVFRDLGSPKISRCLECEIVFNPKKVEECCSDCLKGIPFSKHKTDYIYLQNMLSFSDDHSLTSKRSIANDAGTNKVKRTRLTPEEDNCSDSSQQKKLLSYANVEKDIDLRLSKKQCFIQEVNGELAKWNCGVKAGSKGDTSFNKPLKGDDNYTCSFGFRTDFF